ncbi:hypothetical protein CHELA1G2_13174 [Hyphomicrobiales bacterium]|nr:hypothetical protein CHELA1G2_13174 [Hyphomicrobiales bacterium]
MRSLFFDPARQLYSHSQNIDPGQMNGWDL